MQRPRFTLALASLTVLFVSAPLVADTVYLRNGSAIDGIQLGTHEGFLIVQIGNLGKIRIPEKQILSVEKNNRTGYVDPNKGKDKADQDIKQPTVPGLRDDLEKKALRTSSREPGTSQTDTRELDPELVKQVKGWVYDLTRERSTHRARGTASDCDRHPGGAVSHSHLPPPYGRDSHRGDANLQGGW